MGESPNFGNDRLMDNILNPSNDYMQRFAIFLAMFLPTTVQSGQINIDYPSAVIEVVDEYSAECAANGGELELDGDEISKIWTDEGEEAYVIRAAFTCGTLGHLWCGAMGHCKTDLVIDNELYDTNKILQQDIARISKAPNGTVIYWLSDGSMFMTAR